MDIPAGATHVDDHTGFLHLSSAVLALIFLARRIQPFLSLTNRDSRVLCTNNELIVLHLLGMYVYYVCMYVCIY